MSEIKPIAETYMDEYGDIFAYFPNDVLPGKNLYGAAALAQARAEERERCAKECEDEADRTSYDVAQDALVRAAGRIRALSDTDERK